MSSNASSSSTADDGSFVKIDSKDVKLRQRKTSITGRKKSQSQLNTEAILSGSIDSISRTVPEQYAKYVQKLKPVISPVMDVLYIIVPYVFMLASKLKDVWEMLQPYHPEELGGAFCGLLMVYFGGTYVSTIAAVEAFRQCGWQRTETHVKVLMENYRAAKVESAKDDARDDDGDGIPDIQQISNNDLYRRKLLLLAKSVNPDNVTNALAGIWSGVFGVVCTLRIQFAQAVTLGAAIGDVVHKGVHKYLEPTILTMIPEEHNYLRKWVPSVVRYTCRSFAVSIAWLLQRVISAFHSAIRGSEMTIKGVSMYLKRHGHIDEVPKEGSQLWFCLMFGLAISGFLWQLRMGFTLPFPLNVIFLPFSIFEWFLTNMIGSNL